MRQPHPAAAPRAKKSLGQHFLKNPDICDRIAALLEATAQDNILEIGPGPGALTRSLEALPHARLLLLEKDRYWAGERQRAAQPGTQAVLTDALRFAWARITPAFPWKLAGNLPYNVASPLIWDCLSQATGCTRAVFMVQKEVADRMQEGPGSKEYGALSLAVQYYAKPEIVVNVPPSCFMPQPKVGSAVIRLTRHSEPPVNVKSEKLLFQVIRASFNQRRKTLANGLANYGAFGLPKEELQACIEELGVPVNIRGEALSLEQFAQLSNIIYDHRSAV